MGKVMGKFQIRNLIFIIAGMLLAAFFLGSLVKTSNAQSPTCYDPATGAACTDTPAPTCGLPGLPACPTEAPPKHRQVADTPQPTNTPTHTMTPTATATATVTVTALAPCVNPASGSNANPYRPTCTPPPCFSIGSDRQCTATPTISGVGVGTNARGPLPPYLLIGGTGGIIIVCVLGIGSWMRSRGSNRGMGDGSVKPPNPNNPPTDPFAKIEINPGPSQDGVRQFDKVVDQFAKIEVNPGPVQDGASQFDKVVDQFAKIEGNPGPIQDGASQFAKIEVNPGPTQDGVRQFAKIYKDPGPVQDGASQFQKADTLGSNTSRQTIKGKSLSGQNLKK